MTADTQNTIIRIISENILTPVIYMIENDQVLDFICFCDRNITMQDIYNTEQMIKNETGLTAEIIDIREFGEAERLDVINHATLIHSEHPVIETIFTQSMIEDLRIVMEQRKDIMQRKKQTGSFYLQ